MNSMKCFILHFSLFIFFLAGSARADGGDVLDMQWDGCRKETDYYEKSYGSRRNSDFRDTQVDIKDNSWSFEAGLRTCQNNSSSIRNGGKGISFIRKNGHILRGGERMQVKGLFLNYKKNRRLMQYFFKIRELV